MQAIHGNTIHETLLLGPVKKLTGGRSSRGSKEALLAKEQAGDVGSVCNPSRIAETDPDRCRSPKEA